jgi:hypothetical protein
MSCAPAAIPEEMSEAVSLPVIWEEAAAAAAGSAASPAKAGRLEYE